MPRKKWKYIVLVLALLPLLTAGFTFGYFVNKIWQVSKIITVQDSDFSGSSDLPDNISKPNSNAYIAGDISVNENVNLEKTEKKGTGMLDMIKNQKLPERGTKTRINVLILGKAVPNYPGSDLTDTIILASINPTTYQSSLLSIPRDLYVEIPDTNRFTKINAVYVYGLKQGGPEKGVELLKRIITEVTGQKVDYYVMVNFTAFENVVDALSGVDVNVEDDIYDNRYPGPNYSYQTFEIKKGWHHLNGAEALKYVRVRHTAGGDFGRAKRQQQVIEAAKDKFFEKRGLMEGLDFFNQVLKIVENNVKTDIPFSDYLPFLLLAKDVNVHQVVNKVLDNSVEGLLENYNPVIGRVMAYTLRPRDGNYYRIHELASYIFDLNKMERQDKARVEEKANVTVLTSPELAGWVSRVQNLLRNKGYQIVAEPLDLDPVFIWQRRAGVKLPVVSGENRGTISSGSLVDKAEISSSSLKQTVIYDNAEGSKPFSLEDLNSHLKAQVSLYKEVRSGSDFVVILGRNVSDIFQRENGEFFLTEEGMEQEKAESGQ